MIIKNTKYIIKFTIFSMLISILSCILFQSCSPDTFSIYLDQLRTVHCQRMSKDYDKIIILEDNNNTIEMQDNALLSMKYSGDTQFNAELSLRCLSGQSIFLYLRTTESNFNHEKNIKIEINKEYSSVMDADGHIKRVDSIKLLDRQVQKLKIINDASIYTVMLDCDTIVSARTKLPSTEYLIFETLGSFHLFGINFDSNLDWFMLDETNKKS